tara:strand:- start:328 stop:684 length:357 start_codon:yes stop_codon:yes gene_type:complete
MRVVPRVTLRSRIFTLNKEEDKIMSRRCMITGKGPMSGNNVSHAQNKTRRRFLPNIQDTNLYSEILKRTIRVRASAAGLRTLDHKGGLDQFLMNTPVTKLDPALRQYKTQISKVQESA